MAAMDVKYKPVLFPNGGSVKKVVNQAAMAPAMVGLGAGEVTVYRECLKNHAAALGGHALDGCGEFMTTAAAVANPADPSTFKCAACGCHRNFHRRMVMEGSPPPPGLPMLHGQHLNRGEETPEDRLPAVHADDSDSDSDGSEYDDERSVSPPPPLIPIHPAPVAQQQPPYFASGPHMLMPLEQRIPAQVSPATAPPAEGMPARKRYRTKFTAEQKQRMQELSERLGWRLHKRDEATVDNWCRNIGVSKAVFKVWMHNNKHNYLAGHSARRSAAATTHNSAHVHLSAPAAAATANGAPAPVPFHLPAAAAAASPPPFNPSTSHSSPAPTTTTEFNINGTASSAAAAVHPENATPSQSA